MRKIIINYDSFENFNLIFFCREHQKLCSHVLQLRNNAIRTELYDISWMYYWCARKWKVLTHELWFHYFIMHSQYLSISIKAAYRLEIISQYLSYNVSFSIIFLEIHVSGLKICNFIIVIFTLYLHSLSYAYPYWKRLVAVKIWLSLRW